MTTKKARIKHPPEFKAEALKLTETVGVTAAVKQLSLQQSQLYGLRKVVNKDTKTSRRRPALTTGK